MNTIIWIRDPYSFRFDEYDMLQEALKRTFGYNIVYMREWPVDYVCIDGFTITTCKQIAATLLTVHRMHAKLDKKYRGSLSNYCQNLEIYIQKPGENRPTWADAKEKAQ